MFILPNAEAFLAWNIGLSEREQRRETCPCLIQQGGGRTSRGTLYYTLEWARVRFCAPFGSIAVGQQGQLSSAKDQFYDVSVLFLEPAEDHMVVYGQATRKFAYENDR